MAVDVGKVFEAELETVFRSLRESHLMAWHRFPDTHSAGGSILQSQPSDYLLGLPPGASVPSKKRGGDQRLLPFEAKASEKHPSLQKSAIRSEQRGFIHFYAGMLRLPYLVCHYSTLTGNIQVWDGLAITESRLNKDKHLLTEFSAGSGRKLNIDKCALALVEFFSLPDKLKTVKLYNQF
jgi:hypothetical protein